MKNRYLVFLIVIFSYSAFSPLMARTIYVSTSAGNDKNTGFDINYPTKDIRTAVTKADTILLKAGDVFYLSGLSLYGKVLSKYGEGTNPTICGYKRIIEPRWEKTDENMWRFSGSVAKVRG